jgi:hypothetical protein
LHSIGQRYFSLVGASESDGMSEPCEFVSARVASEFGEDGLGRLISGHVVCAWRARLWALRLVQRLRRGQ